MDIQDGSAHQLSRLPRAVGSLPGFRTTDTLTTHPTQSITTRNTVGPRRKRTTDHAFSTDKDWVNGQNKRVLRPRTKSSTDIESYRLRPTKVKPPSTGVSGYERTPLSVITSAGAPWKQSKSKLPIRICSTNNLINKPRKTGENTVKTSASDSSPHPTFSSAILNVGLFDVVHKNVTRPTNYLSLNTLDDLSRWDMDSLPSIPSPPTSPEKGSLEASRPTPPWLNPFATPIEDDALLGNEIPFPLNRHSKVVHENMGVKKSKNVARTKNISGPTVSQTSLSLTRSEPLLPFPIDHTLPGLPHPLPLHTLCQNTATPNPLASVATSPHPVKSPRPTPSPKVPSAPSTSWRDSFGCIHLGAADCELSIAFPETSHYEFWDVDDHSHLACPVLLCLLAKDIYPWSGKPLALPEVTLFDIRCEDLPLPSRMAMYNPADEFTTHYTGSKISGPAKDDTPTTHVDRDDITVEAKWVRTYSRPGVPGSGGSNSTPTRVLRRGHAAVGARGWYLKFWVPVPSRLFVKRETRVFSVGARVWMNGDEEKVLSLDDNEDGRVYPLFAEAQMSVTHLRTLREMDGWGR